MTGSGFDNGQPFPSINTMDRPAANADGSTDIYFGPQSPGDGKNWLRTLAEKGFFVILPMYGPTKAFFDQSWKPGDLERIPDSRASTSRSTSRIPEPSSSNAKNFTRRHRPLSA